jgi:hypothetical protein
MAAQISVCAEGLNGAEASTRNVSSIVFAGKLFSEMKVSANAGPTQRTLSKVNHKVTQRTKLIHGLPQTRCVSRCQVQSSYSESGDMGVRSDFNTDVTVKSAKPVGVILVRISVRLYFIMSERLIDATSILHYELEAPPV